MKNVAPKKTKFNNFYKDWKIQTQMPAPKTNSMCDQ